MDEVGTARQAREALAALASFFPEIRALDAHAATRGRCDRTPEGDGRHYPAVEAAIALDFFWRVVLGFRGEPDASLLRANKTARRMCARDETCVDGHCADESATRATRADPSAAAAPPPWTRGGAPGSRDSWS